jgi:hypothetical protein
MRFQVPQFIDIEDRIIGPLTLKMFGFYALAFMILVPLYVLLDLGLFITLALPVVGIAALFAHVRLQGQSFAAILTHAVYFFVSPRIYLWRRGNPPYQMVLRGAEYDEYTEVLEPTSSLRTIAQMLNAQGNVSAQDAADPMLAEEGAEEVVTDTPPASAAAPPAKTPAPPEA